METSSAKPIYCSKCGCVTGSLTFYKTTNYGEPYCNKCHLELTQPRATVLMLCMAYEKGRENRQKKVPPYSQYKEGTQEYEAYGYGYLGSLETCIRLEGICK